MAIHFDPIRAHRAAGVADRYEFVPNRNSDYVNIFHLPSGDLAKRVQVGKRPDVTATTLDGRYVYVTGEYLCAIDLSTLEIVRIFTHEAIQVHYAVNLFPDGRRMFLYNYDGSIVVLKNADDPARIEVERVLRINQPALPDASVGGKGHFTADGRRYINPNWHANNIFALDLHNDYAHSIVATGEFDKPDDLVMTTDERKGYTASHGEGAGVRGALHVFDPASGQITRAIRVGRKPAGLTMSPDSRCVYVTNVPDGSITAVETLTDEICFTASAAEQYRAAGITGDHLDIEGVTISADGKTLYAYAVNYGALVVFEDLGGRNTPHFYKGDV